MKNRLPFSACWWPLLSGALLWLSFPNFSCFPLAWIALVPYLLFLLDKPGWKRVTAGHFLLAGIYFGGVLYWIPRVLVVYGNLNWPVALLVYLLLILAMGAFLLPFSVLVGLSANRSPRAALLSAPGLWVMTELARNYFAMNGFPWALVGYTQYPYLWFSQVADLSGIYLVSFLVVLGNCAVAAVIRFRSWRLAVACLLIFAGANLYGIYRVHFWQPDTKATLKVALIQPGISLSEGIDYYARRYFESLPKYYRQAVEQDADWVIFPEAQNPYSYQDFYFRTFWQRQVAIGQAYLLFNSTSGDENSNRYYNSAFLLGPGGKLVFRYDKTELVPFGEYVPLGQWLQFVQPLVQEVSAFSPGQEIRTGSVNDTAFATLICYESIFPELSGSFVEAGAEVLVNITNDSWFGHTAAPEQHLQMAAFRAIEYRKPLLRSANTGYSASVDVYGQIDQRLGLFTEGMLMTEVAGNSSRSIYSYIGEWLNIAIVAISLVIAGSGP
ncbi:MAG: apolipoprotein N-acyltransferase, partial [Acidobacteriota bacterium]